MSAEQPILLLDTNIWIDNYLGWRSKSQSAKSLILLACQMNYGIAYSATSVKDVFYLIQCELKRLLREERGTLSETDAQACSSIAWACVQNMTEIAIALPVGETQIWLARQYRDLHDDYEDDLVLAAAETSKVDYLVTNDKNLLGKSAIPTFTSDDMLAFFSR